MTIKTIIHRPPLPMMELPPVHMLTNVGKRLYDLRIGQDVDGAPILNIFLSSAASVVQSHNDPEMFYIT